MPTLSIVMPLYNKAAYVLDAIASVLAQTFSSWELWVVDNGSTDGSDKQVETIKDSRIQLVRSPQQGPSAARNFGLHYATGEWILFLDADDLLELDYLTIQLETARQNPTASVIVGGWQEFRDASAQARVVKSPAGVGKPPQDLREGAIAFVPWAVHAALIRRSALTQECLWPEELDGFLGEDLAFWFRIVNRYEVAYSPSQGALYRIHTPQCRTQNHDIERWSEGLHRAIAHNLEDCRQRGLDLSPGHYEALTRLYQQLYQQARRAGHRAIATQAHQFATNYLQHYLAIAPQPRASMRLRQWLGLRLFSQLVAHLS